MVRMITTNEVYRMIREMSTQEMNPRPSISIQMLAYQLSCQREAIMRSLVELKNERLISFNERVPVSVKLTLLGFTAM